MRCAGGIKRLQLRLRLLHYFVPATGAATGTAGSEQGTKRKRGGQSEDDDDESGAHGEGSNDAGPLWGCTESQSDEDR